MTEPAYSEEDLRRAEKVVRQADACSFDKRAAALILANNFASVRRERDEAAEKLAEMARVCVDVMASMRDGDPDAYAHAPGSQFALEAALTAYERSRA